MKPVANGSGLFCVLESGVFYFFKKKFHFPCPIESGPNVLVVKTKNEKTSIYIYSSDECLAGLWPAGTLCYRGGS